MSSLQIDHTWRKLYRSESCTHRLLPLAARWLRDHLLRYPEDVDGFLFQTNNLVEDLCRLLGANDDSERELVRHGVTALLRDGYVTHDDSGNLYIRNFSSYQSTAKRKKSEHGDSEGGAKTQAERARDYRERKKQEAEKSAVLPVPAENEQRDSITNITQTSHRDASRDDSDASRVQRREEKKREREDSDTSHVTPSLRVLGDTVTVSVDWEPPKELLDAVEMLGVPRDFVVEVSLPVFRAHHLGEELHPDQLAKRWRTWCLNDKTRKLPDWRAGRDGGPRSGVQSRQPEKPKHDGNPNWCPILMVMRQPDGTWMTEDGAYRIKQPEYEHKLADAKRRIAARGTGALV